MQKIQTHPKALPTSRLFSVFQFFFIALRAPRVCCTHKQREEEEKLRRSSKRGWHASFVATALIGERRTTRSGTVLPYVL